MYTEDEHTLLSSLPPSIFLFLPSVHPSPSSQALLSSLSFTYSLPTGSEPESGERLISITVSDGIFQSTIVISIHVQILNNNPPEIAFNGSSTLTFTEGSMAALPVGSLVQVLVTDADNNDVFLMQRASVVLHGVADGESESIGVPPDTVAALSALNLTVGGNLTAIIITGGASASVYQQALSSVTYTNTAPEPSHSPRTLSYQVFDDVFPSNIITATLNIALVNDNVLMLSCGVGVVTFVEGSQNPISVADGLTLVDMDEDHVITGATVTLQSPQEGDALAVNPSLPSDLAVSYQGETGITVSGSASDEEYQVSGWDQWWGRRVSEQPSVPEWG